jgi:signal peptidase I
VSDSIGGAALTASGDDDRPQDAGTGSGPDEPETGGPGALLRGALEVVVVLAIALGLSLIIKTFLVQAFFIPSASMEATLVPGDRVLVSKLTPGPFDLKHGDVVVFADPGNWLDPVTEKNEGPVRDGIRDALTFVGLLPENSDQHLVKRLIGLPGDKVACCNAQGKVTVNGKPIDETYLYPGDDPAGDPAGDPANRSYSVTVPAGYIWVLGDHRSDSADSRYHRSVDNGMVPISDVVGKAFIKIWPLNRFGPIPNPLS